MTFVPVNEPLLTDAERSNLNACIDQGWLSSEGPFVARFEAAVAEQAGRRHGIAVSSGSGALEVAVAALELGPGDEVIVPSMTIISSLAPIVRAGATPVLVDVRADTWNMDVGQVAERVTPRTRAVMVVHLYGLPVDMEPILAIAERHGLAVIEDAAEMHGQDYRGRPCGGFGDLSVFSFYANKHVTTGEGGMLLTDDDGLAERCRSLRNLCFDNVRRFVHDELGWNFRMTNMQAAVGLAQMERLRGIVERKREIGRFYTERLRTVDGLILPLERTGYAENIYWVYGLVLDDSVDFEASTAMSRLQAANVGTRPFFWPMHEQPVFRRARLFEGETYPVTERLARRGFYVPSGLALTDEQQLAVCDAVAGMMA
ncbi:MAG: DegT/DnrJ/EryC1/StrS family aminotransferase [Gammaproteobacteria bacterium]|nr:DegT/DnrJ/EryC1/StrS family aminotransferase [Gammaproteobacteria bacterium]